MLLSHSHSSMQVFATFMLAVAYARAVPAGMYARSPGPGHVHAVVGAHLLLLLPGSAMRRSMAGKMRCKSSSLVTATRRCSRSTCRPCLFDSRACYLRMQHVVTTCWRGAHRFEVCGLHGAWRAGMRRQCVVLFAMAIARGLQTRGAHAHVTRCHVLAATRILAVVLSASMTNSEHGRHPSKRGIFT